MRPPGRWLVAGLVAAIAAAGPILSPLAPVAGQEAVPFPGEDFTLTLAGRSALLTWQGGSASTATRLSLVVGYTPGASEERSLPVTATSATDEIPPSAARACYTLFASNASRGRASQQLCAGPGVGAGRRPSPFLIQMLGALRPALAWASVKGATAYLLVTIPQEEPFRGQNQVQVLPAPAVRDYASDVEPAMTSVITATIGGGLTCYLVAVVTASGIVGWSDILCDQFAL